MQTRPDKNIPPPQRPVISATLLQLKKGESWFFEGCSPGSVQAIISRIKRQNAGLKFTSEWQKTGLRVWRIQ